MLPSRLRALLPQSVCLARVCVCVSFPLHGSCWDTGRGRSSTDLNITGAKRHLLRAERPEGRGTHKVPTQQPFDALNDGVHSFRRCAVMFPCESCSLRPCLNDEVHGRGLLRQQGVKRDNR